MVSCTGMQLAPAPSIDSCCGSARDRVGGKWFTYQNILLAGCATRSPQRYILHLKDLDATFIALKNDPVLPRMGSCTASLHELPLIAPLHATKVQNIQTLRLPARNTDEWTIALQVFHVLLQNLFFNTCQIEFCSEGPHHSTAIFLRLT